jgi:uncharacterized protein (DUF58 family)
MSSLTRARQWWPHLTWRDIRNGLLAILTILLALGCAMASSLAIEEGSPATAAVLAGFSLVLAAGIALMVVPRLFRNARREWMGYALSINHEGWAYLAVLTILMLAAVNTGNNLIYIIFSAALAALITSGLLSYLNLRGLNASIVLPDVIHARQVFHAVVTLQNDKPRVPSISLLVEPRVVFSSPSSSSGDQSGERSRAYCLLVPGESSTQQKVRISFPRRGRYRLDLLEISSGFPFGFVCRRKRDEHPQEIIIFPELEPPNEFFEILPLLDGSFESHYRGMGTDLYSIRDYAEGEEARFLDWKATAKTGKLQIREFTRQDERRCCFVFDNYFPRFSENARPAFEKAVRICANAIRHFHEMGNETRLVTRSESTSFSKSGEALLQIMTILALIEPSSEDGCEFSRMAEDSSFKVVFTALPRGSIPTGVWVSSHVVFLRELAGFDRRLTR